MITQDTMYPQEQTVLWLLCLRDFFGFACTVATETTTFAKWRVTTEGTVQYLKISSQPHFLSCGPINSSDIQNHKYAPYILVR
jgi:hypothetical protein